ncbi:MAG: hypothetical protein IT352_05240 [Gemmatimonadales bacterium]|nr:hypothetical protein [Gemmatimonadales bacterium]
MPDDNEDPAPPPEPSPDDTRTGQGATPIGPVVQSGLPAGSLVRELPTILLEGAREARHSELTWKLISKIAAVAEDDKASLREELAAERRETEKWRTKAEEQSNTITDLRARWDSVSTLSGTQALLYVVGGLLTGPAVSDGLNLRWVPQTVTVALLGIAAIVAAFLLGRLGPKKEA